MIRAGVWLVLASVLCGFTPAQFRTGVDAVRVDVLVTDGNRPLAGLVAADFDLRDAGVVQTIESVAVDDVPISMMLVLDTSQSVAGGTLARLIEGVRSALGLLTPQDRAAVMTFASDIRLVHDWSWDLGAAKNSVTTVPAGGGTSLWDATFAGLTHADTSPTVRRLVLVFSDGSDTTSWLPRRPVIEKARHTDAVVYAVSLRSQASAPAGATLMGRSGIELSTKEAPMWLDTGFLEEVAEATGGTEYLIQNSDDLRGAFGKIVTEFRTRYVLTYTPRGVDQHGWHPVDVKLKARRGTVRARRGYSR